MVFNVGFFFFPIAQSIASSSFDDLEANERVSFGFYTSTKNGSYIRNINSSLTRGSRRLTENGPIIEKKESSARALPENLRHQQQQQL